MKRISFLIGYSVVSLAISSTLVFSSFAVPVKKAEAAGGLATEATALLNKAESSISSLKNTLTAANTGITAGATTQMFIKENLLDGIGWAIAKQMVSSMTRSLINWINSGFQGSPAFITDLKAHLLNAIDSVAGEFIRSLGDFGEFICSPFRLDVQAALSINYQQARSGMPSGPTACTLSGIADNIENFLDGATSGWDQWFKVTANPQNTPLGAYLEAEAKLNARLVNEAGRQIQIASWGDGFLSKKICEGIEGSSGGKKCTISTPGKVISEALTFQLSTGPRALIEADEINEIIGALLNQLVQQAVSGINGLLGLGGNSQYTDYTYSGATTTTSFLDDLENEGSSINGANLMAKIDEQLKVETSFALLIRETMRLTGESLGLGGLPSPLPLASTTGLFLEDMTRDTLAGTSTIIATYNDAQLASTSVTVNIATLTDIVNRYNAADATATTAQAIRQDIVLEYAELVRSGTLSTEGKIEAKRLEWSRVVMNLPIP